MSETKNLMSVDLPQRQSDGSSTSGDNRGNGGEAMKPCKTPPTKGLVGIAMHVLLCFFIFSGQAVNAASSPLDQIPSPSVPLLALLGLIGVLGAVFGAWVNPD